MAVAAAVAQRSRRGLLPRARRRPPRRPRPHHPRQGRGPAHLRRSTIYYHHFIGADGYRKDYQRAFEMLGYLEKKVAPFKDTHKDPTGYSEEVRRVFAYARDNSLE